MCNGLKISEYEVYGLMDFLIINSWAFQEIIVAIILSCKAVCTSYKKSKQTSILGKYFSQQGSE